MSKNLEKIRTLISEDALCLNAAATFVDAPENGALNMFVGRVRNYNMGEPVTAVSYEAFAPLACEVLTTICYEVHEKINPNLRLYVGHFVGKLEIGGISVVIAVGSSHRDDSFKACRYLIEELKVRAPIWKHEHYVTGRSEWVKGHSLVPQ